MTVSTKPVTMKKVAVLLDGPIINDGRVQRTLKVMLNYFDVDLFYLNGNKNDSTIFSEGNIKFYSFHYDHDKNNWLRKNFLIHNIYKFFEEEIERIAEYDVVFCNDYSTLYYGYKAKSLNSNLKLIYDSHEIFIETFNQFYPKEGIHGLIWSPIVYGLKRYHSQNEKVLISAVDKMITVNESLQDYFNNRYGIDSEAVYNVPYLESFEKDVSIKKNLGLSDEDKIILYQGNFNNGRGLQQMIETFSFLPKNYHLVLIGYGVLEKTLKRKVLDLKLNNVHFLGKVDYELLHSFTKTADLGVFLLESLNLSKKFASANKIFEYMKAGIPFLTTNQPENVKIVNNYKCGVIINSISPPIVAEKVIDIFSKPKEYQIMSDNCVKGFIEKYNWKKEKTKLEKLLIEMT